MIAAVMSCWALLLGMALLMIGNGLQGSLLGVRASLEQFPTTVTGILMSAYYVGFLVGSVMTPQFVARVGHVRVFGALASLASTAILIHAVIVDPATWGVVRLISGFCYAGLYVVAESWLNEQATNRTRGQLLSVYMVVSLGGMAAGQGLLNVADPAAATLFMLVSILVSLAIIPMLLSSTRGPMIERLSPMGPLQLYRVSPTGVVTFFAVGITQGAVLGMGAVYAGAAGLAISQISLFMALILFGGMLLQWPIGLLSDRFDRRLVLTVATFLAAACAILANLVGDRSTALLLSLTFLFGGMMMPMYSLALAYTNDYLQPEQMVGASGTLVLIGGSGAALGPTLVAAMMDGFGAAGFFWCLALVHGGIGCFMLYRMTQRSALPVDEQGSFQALSPRATQIVGGMAAEVAASGEAVRPREDAPEDGAAGDAAA